ncbi:MAG: hypothetical protein LBR17_01075 [Bacteroidales bacterium]|jgi:hypothetical protein|nr:hypothetical protein [Bacteroidales bacterium]
MKNDITAIKVSKSNIYQIERMIEDICDKYNLHNYFGLISTSVANAVFIALRSITEEEQLTFSFTQCIGGMSFALQGESKIFANFNSNDNNQSLETIIKMLSNEVYVFEEGKGLEMIFYVNGIEPVQLLNRQKRFKSYFCKTLVNN